MRHSYIYIAIVRYPGVQLAAVHGLTDMLTTANRLIKERHPKRHPTFSVSHWAIDEVNQTLEPVFGTHQDIPSQQTVLVLPGSLDTQMTDQQSRLVHKWIKEQYSGGAIASSVCKGAFILAQTGILDNRTATTHWDVELEFRDQFPLVELKIDNILISDGDIITAGGVMAWLDLGLNLIHRYAGPEVMAAAAKYLLIDPSGREQKFYNPFTPSYDHGDKLVISVQHQLQASYEQTQSLEDLSRKSSVSVRTLIRRFQSALGMSPTTYIQELRIGKAREFLEFTAMPINQISLSVGYEDPSSFRKIFHRISGITPVEYRRRFRVRG